MLPTSLRQPVNKHTQLHISTALCRHHGKFLCLLILVSRHLKTTSGRTCSWVLRKWSCLHHWFLQKFWSGTKPSHQSLSQTGAKAFTRHCVQYLEQYLSYVDWDGLITVNPSAPALWDAFISVLRCTIDLYVPKFCNVSYHKGSRRIPKGT